MGDVEEIKKFLESVKTADEIDIFGRDKNRNTRLKLGLTIGDQEEIIRNLEVHEYISGPEEDHDRTKEGKVWIFKHYYEKEHWLYIKLKEVIIIKNKKKIKCLSCHIDNM